MEPQPQEIQVEGFQEVLISVFDLEQCAAFYQEVLGYECRYKGSASAAQLAFWQLPAEASMEEVVLGHPEVEMGSIRLVKFQGVPQVQIRSSARSWDTGGIFDLNFRVRNIADRFQELQQRNWHGLSDPRNYQFGEFNVSEVLLQGHDGVHFALIERHAPPLEGYSHVERYSQVFNSSHICRDATLTRHFFEEQLGFKTYMHVYSKDRKAEPNILGFPANINAQLELDVYIVHPEGKNWGSLEFIEIKGLEGQDFGPFAQPPNLGLLMYRFPVRGLAQYAKQLVANGITLHCPITRLPLAPYGEARVFAVRSPDGVWMEFFEIV